MISDFDETRMADIPPDFPRTERLGSVAGAQPKVLLTSYQGKMYRPGLTPPEVYDRWLFLEGTAQQLSMSAAESKRGKRAHMTEDEILDQYARRLKVHGIGTSEEMDWLVNRTGLILGWRTTPYVPANAECRKSPN